MVFNDSSDKALDCHLLCLLTSSAVTRSSVGGAHLLIIVRESTQQLKKEVDREIYSLSFLDVIDCHLDEWISHATVIAGAFYKDIDECVQS
jgi:hypothetical protein